MPAKRKRLFGYREVPKRSAVRMAFLVSERKLPKPSKRFKGACVDIHSNTISLQLCKQTGAAVDLAVGALIVLRRCTMLSLEENPVPEEAMCLQHNAFGCVFVFRYRGARIWGVSVMFSELCSVENEHKLWKGVRR